MSERGVGRRERELDPEAGPVQRFACALRDLRRAAGSPTYRVMAAHARYSVTALSQAAAGERLPTLPVTLAYVRACGGDPEEWEGRWRQAAEAAARPPEEDDDSPPYRGLTRFEPGDAALFFGRDRLVDRLTALTRRSRFTAVFGPSGSGKSSLLRAGLIPRLRASGEDGPAPSAVRILTPGDAPLLTHADRLAPAAESDTDTWLIVDQFEELYTLGADPAQRDAFIDRLLAATEPGSRLRVVIAVRADFLGRCAEHPRLTAALQDATLLVGPMSREELREAVVRPATAAGLIVERTLTTRLLDEVEGEPGGLPMMSHALLETWRHRRGRALTERAYEAAGGLHGAVVRTAEQAYGELTGPRAELARRILLRLVTPGDGTPDTRRPTGHDELRLGDPDDTRAVVERLVRARLLTFDDGTVDLAHEALITAWPRLRGWIDAERERLRVHRRLTDAARTWQDLGGESAALYQGSRLADARHAFPDPGHPAELTDTERTFLDASVRQRRRGIRLRRTVTAVLAGLVLLASGTAVVALQLRATAQAERDTAVFGQVTAEADGLRETRASLAARLDVAAHRMRSTPDLYTRLVGDASTVLSTRIAAHDDIGSSVDFSPDGRTLVSAGHDGILRLWDMRRTGRPEALGEPLRAGIGPVSEVAFAPGAGDLLAAAGDGTLRLWDVGDRSRPRPLGPPVAVADDRTVSTLAFSPDAARLATGDDDGTLRLWDVRDPARPRQLGDGTAVDPRSVRAVAFSPDGSTLATGGYEGAVRLWDVTAPERPEPLGEPLTAHEESVWTVTFSPDGRTLATGGYDETVRLWDVTHPERPAPRREALTGHTAAVWSLAFSADSRTLATAGQDDTLLLWNVTNPDYPQRIGPPLTGHTGGLWAVAFSPDGRTLATTGYDHTVRLWHRPRSVLTDFTNPVTSVAYSPDGDLLAAASTDDALIRLWNLERPGRPRLLEQPLTGNEDPVAAVAFSPDGRLVASGAEDGTVRLWDVTDPGRPRALDGSPDAHEGGVLAVAFSPDGRTLASAGRDGTARLWDVSAPERPAALGEPLTGHQEPVTSLDFAPDGRTLATGGEDDTVRLWNTADPASARPLGRPLTGHIDMVRTLAFSPDGRTLASGGADRAVRLWDVSERSAARPVGAGLTAHRAPVRSVAFSPDGRTLASGSGDRTVRLWDVAEPASAEPLGQPLTGHVDTVTTVAFSPGGTTLASAGYDLTARLWTLDAARAADTVCARTRGVLTPAEWREHLPGLPYRRPCGDAD
ncbi:WD40 repeat domain-containing protein [Streptomyces sp. DSM 42041]|uniref:WD40 repeat domain-containing protein n=1 Tax=Streptomyces hazeniae TaxID=3075538 RepID=A0ABU2NVU9_9ACTN|nr:WD40 repeat domain-containing protein [Streptomyces sp. DSM 42041]MDT0381110.1 WD40 repeat domain-containing protein [Streptomyces sp. DSM 42041]